MIADNTRRLWRGTCHTDDAARIAVNGFMGLLIVSMALIETAAQAVTIPVPHGALAFIAPCCWLIPAGIGIHRSKAWTRDWERRRAERRRQRRDDDRDQPPDPPPSAPLRGPPLKGGGCACGSCYAAPPSGEAAMADDERAQIEAALAEEERRDSLPGLVERAAAILKDCGEILTDRSPSQQRQRDHDDLRTVVEFLERRSAGLVFHGLHIVAELIRMRRSLRLDEESLNDG